MESRVMPLPHLALLYLVRGGSLDQAPPEVRAVAIFLAARKMGVWESESNTSSN